MISKFLIRQQLILTTAHHDYNKRLNAYASFRVNDYTVGEDLVQNTFKKTWSYLLNGGKIDTMGSFLYHILSNLIVDEYRKSKTISLDALRKKGFEPSTNEPEQLFNVLDGGAVHLLIHQLPEKYQKVIHMRYIQDLSPKEISLIVGQSKNAITVQTHRGIQKLQLLYNSSI